MLGVPKKDEKNRHHDQNRIDVGNRGICVYGTEDMTLRGWAKTVLDSAIHGSFSPFARLGNRNNDEGWNRQSNQKKGDTPTTNSQKQTSFVTTRYNKLPSHNVVWKGKGKRKRRS